MAAFFFDTSGIVKRYVQEIGTAWVQHTANPTPGNVVYLARISAVEVPSRAWRRGVGARADNGSLAVAGGVVR
jgi:hypothetical protein